VSDDQAVVVGVMGTSLTARGAWLASLPSALSSAIGRDVSALNFSKVGATSRWGVLALDQIIETPADIMIIEFAINDAAMHRRISLRESEINITGIARRLRSEIPKTRVYLMTMNPARGLSGLVRPRLTRYYDLYAKIAHEQQMGLIDNRASWNALTRKELRAAIPDGGHPTDSFSLAITLKNVVKVLASDLRS
jgi:acyl-CoA thioesterase I